MADQSGHEGADRDEGRDEPPCRPLDAGHDVDRARDADRLRALEQRLAQQVSDDRLTTPGVDKFAHANQAWRMVVELVAGLAIGFGFGFGLDRLLGTTPIMLVIFVFLGFAAGVTTMLRTAAEMGQTPGKAPAGTKGTKRGD